MSRYLEHIRAFFMDKGEIFGGNYFNPNTQLAFILAVEYTIDKSWYNITTDRFLHETPFPFVVTQQYKNHGSSSVIKRHGFYND